MNMNVVVLSGNLTRSPELLTTQGGLTIAKCRLAVNERRKDQSGQWGDVPNYFDITIFGKIAEFVGNDCVKGTKFSVQGRLSWREWTDKQDNKRQSVEVIADRVEYPRSGVARDETAGAETAAAPAAAASSGSSFGGYGAGDGPKDDDIPFVNIDRSPMREGEIPRGCLYRSVT